MRRMDEKRVFIIWLCLLLGLIPPRQGNPFEAKFREFWKYISNDEHDQELELVSRNKRITDDDAAASFVDAPTDPFSYAETGDRITVDFRGTSDEPKDPVSESKFNEQQMSNDKKIVLRSLEDEFEIRKSRILEQRATLRRNKGVSPDNLSEERSFESVPVMANRTKSKARIISRKSRPSMTLKTISSLSVPAAYAASIDNSLSTDRELVDETSSDFEDETSADKYPIKEVNQWPVGRYGLPKSVYGCPSTYGFSWKVGFRYHDTEDDGTENQRSDVFHLAANFSEDGISHEFCIKDTEEGEGNWPSGKYCIYKRGPVCPKGLQEGFVIWDDENTDNQNDKAGALPEGHYGEDTKIFFCCSVHGRVKHAIALPSERPFFLFAYGSINCQKIHNMKSTSEFIKFDDEDHGNTDFEEGEFPYGIHKGQKDHMLFLCYYEPEQPGARSFIVEPEMTTNLASDEDAMKNLTMDDDQETIRQSEEMMREFLQSTGGEEDESAKKERTKAIIKTIKVSDRSHGNSVAVILSLICGGIVIGIAMVMVSRRVFSRPAASKSTLNKSVCETVETTWPVQPADMKKVGKESDDEEQDGFHYVRNDHHSDSSSTSHSASDFEEEEEELVEDQLLPDSELKSGLELLFLKQQRHYWNQRRRHDRDKSDS